MKYFFKYKWWRNNGHKKNKNLVGFIKNILLKMGTTTEYRRIFLIWEANPPFSHSALIRWCQCNPYFPNWWKREIIRKRREEGEEENMLELLLLHPTIKAHDFLDAFIETLDYLLIYIFSSCSFISIFSSLEPMHLPIF